jgi:BirA family biotin operon repressor/biotin-[acetyl-CoA-carboxylase] ligase
MTGSSSREPLRLLRYGELDSTNDEAKRLADAGAPPWSVIVADSQRAGRGRRGRSWQSPPGNLYLSAILRPSASLAAAAQLGFAAALAVGEALVPRLPPTSALRYKWPNDVLVDGAKIAGILLESSARADQGVAWVVAGIGINLASYPQETAYPATSLAALGAIEAAPELLLPGLVGALRAWVRRWEAEGFEPVRRAWLERALGLGGSLGVRLPRESVTGRFVDLDRDGALLLETATGPRRIAAGEIFSAAA